MMTKQKGFVAALLLTTFFTPMRADAACTPTPDCAELGYTQTLDDCPDGAIKCPWDSSKVYCCGSCGDLYKYTCTGNLESAGEHKCGNKYAECRCLDNSVWENGSCNCDEAFKYSCTGTNEVVGTERCGGKYKACGCVGDFGWNNGSCSRPKCKIADIYYTDNTCVAAANHDSTKTVLGIVVHVNADGVGGQIMTPWPIDEDGKKSASNVDIRWGGYGTDIPSLPNYDTEENASKDYNSCSNTDIIVKQGNASKYQAAWATRKYAPNEATKGKWCLPAAGIMTNIYNNKNAINTAIGKVGGVTYPDCCTWSSSEYTDDHAWLSYFSGSYGLTNSSKGYDYYVRPVLEF